MDLRKLIYLEAIYRYKSFTKAAEELHISQPAITNAINALEEYLQVELIDRSARFKTLRFTEAGERLVQWARRIMEDFDGAEREMRAYSDAGSVTLRLGISNMVGSWLYNNIYSGFMREYPESELIIKEYPWAEICEKVARSELDMAYTTWEKGFEDERLELHYFYDSELYLVLPPDHPLCALERVPIRQLDGQALSVFAESSLIHKIVAERCSQAGISPRLISVTQHLTAMLEMIDQGIAIGFVVRDQKAVTINKSRYALRPLEGPILLETGFILRRGVPPTKIMKKFEQYVRQYIS